MRDGWFFHNGQETTQPMVFLPSHPEFPNMPKGAKVVLHERGLWRAGLNLRCGKGGCNNDWTDCCAKQILDHQPDFQAQKSLVQETIEGTGHTCVFLPKYHCEINFIEYFWGVVKHYLQEHCDYSFTTLKLNMPKALASVPVELIRKWEHRAWRFIDAYAEGLDAHSAQLKVKAYSS
jgi:transposase